MNSAARILFFAPYGDWVVHHQVDRVVAAALQQRGHEVHIVGCDRLYGDCEVVRNSLIFPDRFPAADALCYGCNQCGRSYFQGADLPYSELGGYLTPEDRTKAESWADNLDPGAYPHAMYEDLPIGDWATSSIYTLFRVTASGLSEPHVRQTHRRYLVNALLTFWGLSRLVASYQPTAMMIFNGRLTPYRVALEVATRAGIRFLTHDRGWQDDTFMLFENRPIISIKPMADCADTWRSIPLGVDELETAQRYLMNREFGQNLNWYGYYQFTTDHKKARALLDIPADARVFGVFTSSEHELALSDEWRGLTEQLEIIDRLIDIFRGRSEYLVVRHHPNIFGDSLNPADRTFIAKAYEQAATAPPNVRIVLPEEKFSSYALLWNLDASIAFYSTISLEAAARGVPTAVFAASHLARGVKYTLEGTSRPELERLVETMLAPEARVGPADMTRLYRFIYALAFRLSRKFRSFGIRDVFRPDIRYSSPAELLPGVDPALDDVCEFLLSGTSSYPLPSAVDRDQSDASEQERVATALEDVLRHRQVMRQENKEFLAESGSRTLARIPLQVMAEPMYHQGWPHAAPAPALAARLEDFRSELQALLQRVQACHEPYVMFQSSHTWHSRTFATYGIDSLAETQGIGGVAFGMWLASDSELLAKELFTDRIPASTLTEALEACPELRYPQLMLMRGIFRREALERLLLKVSIAPSLLLATEEIHRYLAGPDVQRIPIPAMILNPPLIAETAELRKTVFLYQVESHGDELEQVIAGYLNSFTSEQDVSLGLWVQTSKLSMESVTARVLTCIREAGEDPAEIPDILLMPDMRAPEAYTNLHHRVDWYVRPNAAIQERRLDGIAPQDWHVAFQTAGQRQPFQAPDTDAAPALGI